MEYRGFSHGEIGGDRDGRGVQACGGAGYGYAGHVYVQRLESIIAGYGLPTRLEGISRKTPLRAHGSRQEGRRRRLRFALPEKLGKGAVVSDPPGDAIEDGAEGGRQGLIKANICVSIVVSDVRGMASSATAAWLEGADHVELRLDCLAALDAEKVDLLLGGVTDRGPKVVTVMPSRHIRPVFRERQGARRAPRRGGRPC
jgi:hypothetical protein